MRLKVSKDVPIIEDACGFTYGPLSVQRTCDINGSVILQIFTDYKCFEVTSTPKGKKVSIKEIGFD